MPRLGALSLLIAMTLLACAAPKAQAQDQREIDLIATLGQEQVAAREQRARQQAEMEHRARLEEQSRLRQAYQEYLGVARRTAMHAVEAK